MTKVDPEVRIPDPIDLDRAEEDRNTKDHRLMLCFS